MMIGTMKRGVLLLSACLAVLSSGVVAGEPITIAGRSVTAETPRYRAVFDGLSLVALDNRLTGESYAAPAASAGIDATGQIGVCIESLRLAVPDKCFTLCERTVVTSEKTAAGITVTYTGLQWGTGPEAEFAKDMVFRIAYSIDPGTGDLVIAPTVEAHIEKAHDVRDRGVYRVTIGALGLAEALRVILPVDHGMALTKDNTAHLPDGASASFAWPSRWEAALFIAEGAKGCMGVWADEPRLRYARRLGIAKAGGTWQAAFGYEPMEMNYLCDGVDHVAWRLNVFEGSWTEAALNYRAVMQKQWPDLKPLADRAPAWAGAVRAVIEPRLPDDALLTGSLAGIPAGRLAVFTREGWRGNPKKPFADSWPPSPGWEYTAPEGFAGRIAAAQAKGLRVFVPVTDSLIDGDWTLHPRSGGHLLSESTKPMGTWRPWARFFPEACKMHVETVRADGLLEGYSWIMRRHYGTEPDGENWFTGTLVMQQYLRELLPATAVMGDQVNEVTCRLHQLSRAVTFAPAYAHPVSVCLFEPYTRQWSLAPDPATMAADEIHGLFPGVPANWDVRMPAMQQAILSRVRRACVDGWESVWPKVYPVGVMHAYRDAAGSEYEVRADHGARLVKKPGGSETLSWWISGVSSAPLAGRSIPGWTAYDGDTAIGLSPAVTYATVPESTRPPVRIAHLPEGVAIVRTVQGDGYWCVTLEPTTPGAAPATHVVTIATGDATVQFPGAVEVKETAKAVCDVTVKVPGSFVAAWGKPYAEPDLAKGPARLCILDRATGMESSIGRLKREGSQLSAECGKTELREEGSLAWLVQLPIDEAWLVFDFGSGVPGGDGARYSVRVNGATAWSRFRKEGETTDKEGKAPGTGAVNLTKYDGGVVLIELVADGGATSPGDSIVWGQPRIADAKPTGRIEYDNETGNDAPADVPGGAILPIE